tara:strand:+ start:141 stop:1133 length:993 start_codon:yes stop_codon:yes gene_type:complete
MATYVNNLRLKEITTGDEDGTWGTSTNTNLELIADSLGYNTQASFGSDANATTTVADGAADPARALYFKVTSGATLSTTRELTIAPNTLSRLMWIENATTGSQTITIKQGSGATINIGTGETKIVYLDGAGAGAAVVDALANFNLNLASQITGTLPVANGGTGITSFGSGVATWIGTPSSANLASAVTDETGSGALVFATSPTLVTPVLGTPASGNLQSCTADGTDEVGFRNAPAVGTKTSGYTLATGDVGKYVQVGSGGSIVIPNSTFAEGDVVSIFNNTTGDVTITCTITTAYKAGEDADIATATLVTRGVATILFISGTVCVITGNI